MDFEWSRRDWLGGLLLFGVGALGADAPAEKKAKPPEPKVRPADLDAIRKRAETAGLKDVGVSESAHYFAVGDAPEGFRKEALQLCEEIASSFLTHFRAKGFTLDFPADKMAVVALKDKESYRLFIDDEVGPEEGGQYNVTEGWLVIFDFRGGDNAAQVAVPQRVNTFSLVHESIHELTYSTGLLSRTADVPVAISEGFATQGELWRKADRVMGRTNALRLRELAPTLRGTGWISVRDLLTNDDLLRDPQTSQIAYGEAWVLIHEMLKSKSGLAKLTSYLSLIKTRRNPGRRVEDAEEAFGKLEVLDRELKQAAGRLLRGSRT
jgi:Protein of unknown function (DUF1570)